MVTGHRADRDATSSDVRGLSSRVARSMDVGEAEDLAERDAGASAVNAVALLASTWASSRSILTSSSTSRIRRRTLMVQAEYGRRVVGGAMTDTEQRVRRRTADLA